jgi:hypothetical protein
MDTNLTIPQGLDTQAVNLARSIRKQESGGDYNRSGDSGSSLGAYQWNNQPNGKSIPLKKGELPSNFTAWAKEAKLDPTDFSPHNQDMVAYSKIKKLKDAGNNVVDIAAIWNGGQKERQDPNYITKSGLPSQKKGIYDVPAYAKAVNDYYQNLKAKTENNGTPDIQTNDSDNTFAGIDTPTTPTKQGTFEDIISGEQTQEDTNNLKSGVGDSLGTQVLNKTADIIGGGTMARSAGYSLNNMLGGNKEFDRVSGELQKGINDLLQKRQQKKSQGESTTVIDKALKMATDNYQNYAGKQSDLMTGGITNKEVKKSAGHLATLPALAYGGSLLSGTSKLASGVLGSKSDLLMKAPAVIKALKPLTKMGLSINQINAVEKVEYLTNALKTSSAVDRQIIQQTIDKLAPEAIKMAGGTVKFAALHPNLAKVLGIGKEVVKYGVGGLVGLSGIGQITNTIKGMIK